MSEEKRIKMGRDTTNVWLECDMHRWTQKLSNDVTVINISFLWVGGLSDGTGKKCASWGFWLRVVMHGQSHVGSNKESWLEQQTLKTPASGGTKWWPWERWWEWNSGQAIAFGCQRHSRWYFTAGAFSPAITKLAIISKIKVIESVQGKRNRQCFLSIH